MKPITISLVLFLLFILPVSALDNSTYGSGLLGAGILGQEDESDFGFSGTVSFDTTKNLTFGSNQTNATLEITPNSNASGFININQYNSKPSNVGTPSANPLNKYIEITLDSSLNNSINHSILRVKYSDIEVSSANLQESTMRLYRWNGSWIKFDGVGSGIDTTNNIVFANTTQFSIWGIFGSTTPSSSPSSSSGGSSSGGGSGRLINGQGEGSFKSGSKTVELNYGDVFRFYVGGQQHLAIILNVNQKKEIIKIRVTSTPIDLEIKKGETKTIDLDDDGTNDLSIKLNSVGKYGGSLFFTILNTTAGGGAGEPSTILPGGITINEPSEEQPDVPESEPQQESAQTPDSQQAQSLHIFKLIGGIIIIGVGTLLVILYMEHKRKGSEKIDTKND